jgi:hypothetical protein
MRFVANNFVDVSDIVRSGTNAQSSHRFRRSGFAPPRAQAAVTAPMDEMVA